MERMRLSNVAASLLPFAETCERSVVVRFRCYGHEPVLQWECLAYGLFRHYLSGLRLSDIGCDMRLLYLPETSSQNQLDSGQFPSHNHWNV